MGVLEISVIGLGLAMDAFAVAVCKGLSMKRMDLKKATIIALYFGIFQAIMPLIGFFLGNRFEYLIDKLDHWVAFGLLSITGVNMIYESLKNEEDDINDCIDVKTMFILSISTSIDALAVGITFAFFKINLAIAISIIGVITFILSIIGVKIGNKFGDKIKNRAELLGGIVLIIIGLKILISHTIFM